MAIQGLVASAAGPVPPPTFIPPVEASFYGATQAMVAGPMGLDVSIYDLSLRVMRTDFFIPGCVLPLQATFIYESKWHWVDSPVGCGWRYLYAASYQEIGDGSLFIGPISGQTQRYWPGSGGLTRPQPGRYELRTSDGTTYYFDDPGHKQVTKIAAQNGSYLVLAYDASGRLTRVTDHYGRHLDFSYTDGLLSSVTDANTTPVRTVQYAYDADANLVSVTDPLGQTTTYAYNRKIWGSPGVLNRVTDPQGNWAAVTYARILSKLEVRQIATPLSAVNFERVKDPPCLGLGPVSPGPCGRDYTTVTDVVDGQKRTTRYDFVRWGIGSITDPQGHITSFWYDSNGNLMELDGPVLGTITRYEYDSAGRLIKMTEPLSRTTTYTYDPATGRVASVTDPLGHTTRYEYDSKGHLIRYTDPLSNTTHYTYDCCHLIAVTDPLSNTLSFSYDAYGYPTTVRDGSGVTVTFRYDARGNLLQETDGRGLTTTYGRDALGRVMTITNPAGEVARLSYDAAGNLARFVDPAGSTVLYSYDALARPVRLNDALGEVNYAFDTSGNFTAITDGQGHKDTFSYDLQGRITSRSDGLGRTTTFVYDGLGNLIRRTDPLSQTTVYTYNAASQLTAVAYPDGSNVTYTYDAAGNLTREANAQVAVDYSYDAADRLTSVTAAGKTISYTYDAASRRATMTDPDGNTTAYTHDGAGRLLSVADPLAGTTTYSYNTAGNLARVDRANGVYSLYAYDAANRLSSMTHHAPGGAVLAGYTYTYDKAGNRTSVANAQGKTTSYTYDGRYRLTGVTYPDSTSATYTYDLAGNRLTENSTAYSYDAADQLLSAGGTTYGWDARGNQTSETAGGFATPYTYDHENRLTGASYADGTGVAYAYYPDGRLYSRTDRAGQTTYYYYDGPNLLLETDTGGSTIARYTGGLALDSWLAMRRGGQTYTYLHDGLNNVVGLTDNTGALVASYQYDAFGGVRSQTGSIANPIRFTGRYLDEDANLYQYRARWYDSTTGRFLSRDPLGPIQVRLMYAYANNNPATYVDPLGLDTWSCSNFQFGGGFLLGGEFTKSICRNLNSGQKCTLITGCLQLGALAGLGASPCGGFLFNGPSDGQDLGKGPGGTSIFAGASVSAGIAGAGVGGSVGIEPTGQVQAGLNICGGLSLGLGLRFGAGGQYCRTTVLKCDKEEEPDKEPEKPPRKPGHDNPDDNYSAASPSLPLPNFGFRISDFGDRPFRSQSAFRNRQSAIGDGAPLLVGQPRVGIFWHGYAEEARALLASWGWSSEPVYLDFAPASLDVPILFIPSGGLYGLESASNLRARLEAYAASGGVIIALAQQHGYEFGALPYPAGEGGGLGGYGWTEDSSCFDASLYVSEYHPILSGFSKATLTAGVDGFFTSLPAGTRTLLHRTQNGQPAFILYPYSSPSAQGGYVVATSLYNDWGTANYQPPADSARLLRDLLSWGVDPDGPLPEFSPGMTATVPLPATNGTSTDAALIQFTILDPNGAVSSQQTVTQTVQVGSQAQLTVQLPNLPAKLGVWWIQYTLLDAASNVVQPTAWGARFAVSQPSPGAGPGKAMGLSITAATENFVLGPATFTFHAHNFTDSARQATVEYGFPEHARRTEDPAYGFNYGLSRTVTVPAQSEINFTHTANILTNDGLFARLSYDSVSQQAWFQIRVVPATVQVSMSTDRTEYARGGMVQATVTLTNTATAAYSPTLRLIAWDLQRTALYSAQRFPALAPTATVTASFAFTVPLTAQPGTATLYAEARDADNRTIGTGSSSFQITASPLRFATALPATLSPGSAQSLVVTATNTSTTLDVISATLAVTLTDPAGVSQPLTPQPFTLPAGQSQSLSVPFTTPVAQFGVYTFSLTSRDEHGTRAWQVTTLNKPALSIQLDQPSYVVRDVMRVDVTVLNSGRWQQSPHLRVEVPAAGYAQTDTLSLAAGGQVTATHSVTLPATLAAGSYPLTATLTLTTGDAIAATTMIVIPDSRLRAALPDTTLMAGHPVTLTIANTGGVDTSASYRAWLQDARAITLQTVSGTLASIRAGAAGSFTFTVPAAGVSGDYVVRGVLTDTQTGRAQPFTLLATVDGVQAELQAATESLIYTQGEPITASATITNASTYPLDDATLHISLSGPATWQWVTHKAGQHGPAGRIQTMMTDSAGVKWMASPLAVNAFDDGGTPFDNSDDRWQLFDTQDGIPYPYVRMVFVDAAGYKWIASYNPHALSVLYDGGTPFDKSDDRWLTYTAADGLPDHVADIAQDAAGNLWLGHVFNGVSVLDPGPDPMDKSDDSWAHFTTANSGLSNDGINAVGIDVAGNKWFGTDDGVSVLGDGGNPFDGTGDTWYSYYWGSGLPYDTANAMGFDADGNKWFGGYYGGAGVLDTGASPFDGTGDTWYVFNTSNSGLYYDDIISLVVDSSGSKWFGHPSGVSVLDTGADPFDGTGDTWGTFENDYLQSDVEVIYPDTGNLVWFGAVVLDYGGLALLDHGGTPFNQADDVWEAFNSDAGIGTYYVDAITAGAGGLTWFGGQSSGCGIRVLDDRGTPADSSDDQWASFHPTDGLPSDGVKALALDQADAVWAGTDSGTAALDHGGTPLDKSDDAWQTFGAGDIGVGTPNAIAVDDANRKWFAGYDQWGAATLAVLDDGGTPITKTDDLTMIFTAADGLTSVPQALAIDQAGVKWIGIWNEVVALMDAGTPFTKTDDVWVTFTSADGLANGTVYDIAVDDQNNIWFATGNGVSLLDHNGTLSNKGDDTWYTYDTDDGLVWNWVTGVAIDQAGDKWFGTGVGLSRLDDGGDPFDGLGDTWQTFTTAHGLGDDAIQVVSVGGDGHIWVGTYEGASVGPRQSTVIWSADQTISLPAAQVTQRLTAVTNLNATGRYVLTARFVSAKGQTLAADRAPFYIVPGQIGLTLDAAPDPVRPGAAITVTGALVNNSPSGLTNQTVTLTQDGVTIHIEGPFNVAAGSSHPFTVIATAPGSVGTTTFSASADGLSAQQDVVVAQPAIAASVAGPTLVGSDPFSLTVSLTNTGAITGQVVISDQWSVNSKQRAVGSGQWTVDVPAGATVLVQSSAQTCADTTLAIPLTGDLTQTLTLPVTFGQALDAAFSPQPTYAPGIIEIPYTFTNTGQLDVAFTTTITLTDSQSAIHSQFDTYLSTGNTTAGSTLFDLLASTYTLTYQTHADVCPLASGLRTFTVASETSIAISGTAGISGSPVPITVTLTNNGSRPFAGTLQLTTDYCYQASQPTALAVGASGTYTFAVDITLASTGVHTATVAVITGAGVTVAQTETVFTVRGPVLSVTSVPTDTLLSVGQTVTLTFGVGNSGDQAGQASLRFTLGDIADETQVQQVDVDGAESFDFTFYVPPELEAKDYLATYDLNDQQEELLLSVQGISLTVAAGTDRAAYEEGESASMLLTVTNNLATDVPGLYALASLGGITQTQAFTLTTIPVNLAFPLTATFSEGGLVFYGIYHQSSQRGIYLNTLRLSQQQPAVTVVLDRDVYSPGDPVQATVLTSITGQLDITAPGYTTTLSLTGSDTGFAFTLPVPMARGSYAVNYRLTGCGCADEGRQYQATFDVAGPLVRVTEARLHRTSYSPGEQVNAWLTVASDQDVDVLLHGALIYPDGSSGATTEQAVHLSTSLDNVLTATATITDAQAGLHLLSYELVDAADPTLVYADGIEAFDVGLASLLSLFTDLVSYPTASDPVTAVVQLYASTALTGQLSLALNGAAPQVETLGLAAGLQTVNVGLTGSIAPGHRVLTATLLVGALASQRQATFDYGTDLPDLTVGPPALAAQPSPTQTLNLIVFNQGVDGAAATSVAVYEGDPDAGGALIGTAAVPALDSGESAVVTLAWNVGGHAPGSDVAVFALVDPAVSIAEFDETNNAASSTITLPSSCREDINGDWHIDVLDIMAVASHWRCRCGNECYNLLYDLDGDCDIDILDIMLVVVHWGETCP